ncbi:MAG: hypothetical protein HQL10_06995 [Nitrospirae bacterium]|nr:hypothetical protein [Nitrospirota bacterium]
MAESKQSSPKVLLVLSLFFVLVGGMVIDPLAGFACFVMSGFLALLLCMHRIKALRYSAFILLVIIIALAVSKFPEGKKHLEVYKSKTVKGNVK